MPTVIINDEAVRRLLPMAECIEVMEEALRTLAGGDAIQPLRTLMRLPREGSLLGMMPGYLGRPEVLGIKVIAFVAANQGTDLDTHQGAVLLFATGWGVVLTTAGAAIGLGNIRRFPYMMGEHGGSAFLALYLILVVSGGMGAFGLVSLLRWLLGADSFNGLHLAFPLVWSAVWGYHWSVERLEVPRSRAADTIRATNDSV